MLHCNPVVGGELLYNPIAAEAPYPAILLSTKRSVREVVDQNGATPSAHGRAGRRRAD